MTNRSSWAALVKVDHEGVCPQKISADDALAGVGHDERHSGTCALGAGGGGT